MMADSDGSFVGERKELSVFREAVCHGKFVGELVIPLDRLAVWCRARNRGFDARLRNEVAKRHFLAIAVTGAQTLLTQRLLLVGGNLIVGDGDALTTAAVLPV